MLSRNKQRSRRVGTQQDHGNGNGNVDGNGNGNASHTRRTELPEVEVVEYPDSTVLYSAPTVDTLGDDSASMRPYATPRHVSMNTTSTTSSRMTLSHSALATPPTGLPAHQTTIAHVNARKKAPSWRQNQTQKEQSQSQASTRRRRRRRQGQENEFQKPKDAMSVTVRTIPIAERSAFDHGGTISALSAAFPPISGSSNISKPYNKISPSPQHVRILQRLASVTHLRQLAFSPSVGGDSDALYPGDAAVRRSNRRAPRSSRSPSSPWSDTTTLEALDGRYRSIDPVQATLRHLPPTPPVLSNKRHRLPMRPDVGFPHATPEEIQQKQLEISHETEWEEASPRLLVLVTSDDLGTATVDEEDGPQHSHQHQHQDQPQERGLPPFCGPELVAAKRQNQQHFFSKQQQQQQKAKHTDTNATTTTEDVEEDITVATGTIGGGSGTVKNHCSVLAPPLGATYSTTLGWRPRPYHDRPATWTYSFICPVQIEFQIGNIEPLVCSLSLYQLSSSNTDKDQPANTPTIRGKASEDFFFPAGQWEEKHLQVDALQGDANLTQQWLQRKHKALLAHDPLIAPLEDLYIVLQVYKVTHLELAAAYLSSSSSSSLGSTRKSSGATNTRPEEDRKSWRRRLKKQFQQSKHKVTPEEHIQRTTYRAATVFETFGTQFLSPLCFGVSPLIGSHSKDQGQAECATAWPAGKLQTDMTLYAVPSQPESPDDFVQRLCQIALPSGAVAATPRGSSATMEESSFLVTSSSGSSKQRKGFGRLISTKKSPKKETATSSEQTAASTATKPKKLESTPIIPAKVTLFVSDLGADFLESMLQTPPELGEPSESPMASPSKTRILPKLLVDLSGESAIMTDPIKSLSSNDASKRSNLVRLPPRPSGYIDASDFREVLFLPPRGGRSKQYDLDATPSHRSLVNLLYLYPRLLLQQQQQQEGDRKSRKSSKHVHTATTRYTVRMSLVESVAESKEGIVEANTKASRSFHNPAPWAGPSLLKSVYTKIPGEGPVNGKQPAHDVLLEGLPLNDEFKLRLPMVLDGNQFLQFTLFSVDLVDDLDDSVSLDVSSAEDACGLTIQSIAETTIPLSSSIRDPVSGTKVATIIPNGCHRLKLGDFQLQVESRLMSSIHVSDPSVATALRKFPFSLDGDSNPNRLQELALVRSGGGSKQAPVEADKVTYSVLFAAASPTALRNQFQPLLFMHLANLVKVGENYADETSEKFLVENMNSLLEICGRVKAAVGASDDDKSQYHIDAFVKAVVDSYDEAILHTSMIYEDTDEDAASEVVPLEPTNSFPSVDLSVSDEEEEDDEEESDGGAIRKRKKYSLGGEIDSRISRTFSAMESSEGGFLRTAYGATKTDRMRLEAELDADAGRMTHLVDDDETVITFATGYSGEVQMMEAREAFERSKLPGANETQSIANSIADKDTELSVSNDFSYKSIPDMGLARRVRSAAQVMLAPCVPPNFFNTSSPKNSGWQEEKKSATEKELPTISELDTEQLQLQHRKIATAGSDIDEGESGDSNASGDALSHVGSVLLDAEGAFRSPSYCPLFRFSIAFDLTHPSGSIPFGRGQYAYESIILLWLQAGMSNVVRQSSLGAKHVSVFSIPSMNEPHPLHAFYKNMDMLLPLCLKSIALRFGHSTKGSKSTTSRVVIDEQHATILESLFELLPLLIVGDAMVEVKSSDKDVAVQAALDKLEHVLDFFVGLCAMFHPAHLAALTSTFFQSLRFAETEGVELNKGELKFKWNEDNLFRVKCSRQMRLRAVEKLAVLPNFIAMNYPMRFPDRQLPGRGQKVSWTTQYTSLGVDDTMKSGDILSDGDDLLPPSGWLAEILVKESLSICALSCEAVVAEAMAHIETRESPPSSKKSSLHSRPTATLKREDLLMFQSIAIHGITCVHELLLRRHAMDRRYQKESSRGRIAALFALPVIEKSLASVRWLARMESTHRVRSLWLLCFAYVLQEAPENLLRVAVSSYSQSSDIQIHRFIRLLRLSSATFQSFIDQPRYCMFPAEIDSGISPWLLQESFNTICATTIIVVEECANFMPASPKDQKKMVHGILDLVLHILTTPQSSVTHLRAIGGAIQALERFGVAMFLDITGKSLQHWIRVILELMNSISLSVRSIAVDFVVSLLSSTFDLYGSIDELAIIFSTVLPEVAAREIALCSVSGHIKSLEDAERAVWPLRRSFADVEDANPLDDDRVDPQLAPILGLFCRACQAVLDGVLIEMRLLGGECVIVGARMKPQPLDMCTFDADEESLFEAANFFVPETAPIQRIRWLMTLKSLQKAKGQWVEAAESLIMCARAIADSIPHLKKVWRPCRFPLWSDARRSLWLATVGEDMGIPERGNEQVMSFADDYLEPELVEPSPEDKSDDVGMLPQPTVAGMCSLLTKIAKEAVAMYLKEGGMDGLAYSRLESLLMILMDVLDEHGMDTLKKGRTRTFGIMGRHRYVKEEASLRKVIATISGDMTKLAERMLLLVEETTTSATPTINGSRSHKEEESLDQYFVRIVLSGKKPTRFLESTTLPTFLEWNNPCICRVPKAIVAKTVSAAGRNSKRLEEVMCSAFAKPLRNALLRDAGKDASITFRLGNKSPSDVDDKETIYVDIGFVQMTLPDRIVDSATSHHGGDDGTFGQISKKFTYRKPPNPNEVISSTFVEVTVAKPFPSSLSRQRSLLTSEFVVSK